MISLRHRREIDAAHGPHSPLDAGQLLLGIANSLPETVEQCIRHTVLSRGRHLGAQACQLRLSDAPQRICPCQLPVEFGSGATQRLREGFRSGFRFDERLTQAVDHGRGR